MVELAESRAMNKKMLKKLERHHRHRHRHGHEQENHDGDEVLRGSLAPNGNEIVVVLRGKHYHHHHHHHHYGPDTLGLEARFHDKDEGKTYSKETKHHHRRGRHGRLIGHRVIEGTLRGLKHHVKRHQHIYQQYCRGLGLDFQYHNQPQQNTEAAAGPAPVTPTAPEAELMMKNLSLAEGKEANKA